MIKKASKVRYSEIEAARKLDMTVEQLRAVVKTYVADCDDPVDSFQSSDLVMLRVVAGQCNLVAQ
jgi:malate synthase